MGKKKSFKKIINDTIKLPDQSGNGILKLLVSVDEEGQLGRYSLTYINTRICTVDNGRVLGYDNSHGYHHRHYMGQEEPVEFTSYTELAEKFETEWKALHEKITKHYR